jgi:hypothetical protein
MPAFRLWFTADVDFTTVLSVMAWCALTLVACIAAYFVYGRFKRWMGEADDPSPTGFSFSDLREMRRQGQISEEEFEKARTKLFASAKEMTEKLPSALADRRQPPTSPPPASPGGAIT